MALVAKSLHAPQYVGSSLAEIFTNPASKRTLIKGLFFFNNNTTAETVAVHIVPNGGSADATNKFDSLVIPAGYSDRTIELLAEGIVLETSGDTIQATTTTASKVTVHIFGMQEDI